MLLSIVAFAVVCLASHRIGALVGKMGLPYIAGYLFTGALVGSFGLGFIPSQATESLRFIDRIALSVIALVAGGELFLQEMRSQLRALLWTVAGIVLITMLTVGGAIFLLTALISFTSSMPAAERVAVSLLGATVLLALSPPSTIAVIKNARARGPFTRLVLAVTVSIDVVIIVLFAVNSSVARALLSGEVPGLGFVGLLLLDLALALACGAAAGALLGGVMRLRAPRPLKLGLVVLVGYSIYALAGALKQYSAASMPFPIAVEPLLVALTAGFSITNFSPHRDEFADLLHDIGPAVYVAFFTLTGIALRLDVLLGTIGVALALFLARALAIAAGAYLGGALAGEPARANRLAWMAFITQAGIALGLAREVAVAFPSLGDAFAALIISVIVLNEIFGPLALREGLRRMGESSMPEPGIRDNVRDALILGADGQALALARRLAAEGWRVRVADIAGEGAARPADIAVATVAAISAEALAGLLDASTDALVAMLPDDQANLRACELARERFGVPRLVVRPTTPALRERFEAAGVMIVDPGSAMVNLLDQAVRAPQALSLLLHADPAYDMVQLSVTNPEVDGALVRDLRLPADALLLELVRDGEILMPHGYTRLRLGDEVTVVGQADDLAQVSLRLGY